MVENLVTLSQAIASSDKISNRVQHYARLYELCLYSTSNSGLLQNFPFTTRRDFRTEFGNHYFAHNIGEMEEFLSSTVAMHARGVTGSNPEIFINIMHYSC